MYRELQNKIKNHELAGAYLFCGKERFLLESTLQLLVSEISKSPGGDLNISRLDASNTSIPELVSLANTVPFFAEKKLIIVDNATWFSNAKSSDKADAEEADTAKSGVSERDTQTLLAYLEDLCESTCLVFIAGEKVNKVKKLTKAVIKYGVYADFEPLKGEQALYWLDGRLKAYDLVMGVPAKQQLLLATGYNCALTEQELAKLACYVSARGEATLDDVAEIVSHNLQSSVFNLIDAVSSGKLEKSLMILDEVLLLESEYMLIPMFANHFQTMFLAKVLKNRGYSVKEILTETGKSHPFVIEKALRQGQAYTETALQKVLEILLQSDIKSKSGVCPPRVALENAIIQICFLTAKSSR